jgi:hypothetical protein
MPRFAVSASRCQTSLRTSDSSLLWRCVA